MLCHCFLIGNEVWEKDSIISCPLEVTWARFPHWSVLTDKVWFNHYSIRPKPTVPGRKVWKHQSTAHQTLFPKSKAQVLSACVHENTEGKCLHLIHSSAPSNVWLKKQEWTLEGQTLTKTWNIRLCSLILLLHAVWNLYSQERDSMLSVCQKPPSLLDSTGEHVVKSPQQFQWWSHMQDSPHSSYLHMLRAGLDNESE